MVADVVVEAEIIEQIRDKKIIVFKKRGVIITEEKAGHRQDLTLIRIIKVATNSSKKKIETDSPKAPVKKEDKMAHKKAGGSTRNGRDSAGRRLGVKNLWRARSLCLTRYTGITSPPNFFTPSLLPALSLPFLVLPPAFLCAIFIFFLLELLENQFQFSFEKCLLLL